MTTDCNWDYGLDRMGGEYFFAVDDKWDTAGAVVRIAYLPAYYVDCGVRHDFLSSCLVAPIFAPGSCDPHTGDSEFILVDVAYVDSSAHWVTQQVFLSAHCGADGDDDCRWWHRAWFAWLDGKRYGAPIVWVAGAKHANYYSQSKCNSGGAMKMDTCEYSNVSRRFPVLFTQQNIGSRATPLRDCAGPFWGSEETSSEAIECMWNTTTVSRFNGWQSSAIGPAATLYGSHLSQYAGF
jgi:hypothetical protein